MGKHDGVMHGGRWLRSTVAIRTNQEIVHCPNKGKCSIDEVSSAPHATACSLTPLSDPREPSQTRLTKSVSPRTELGR